MSSEMLKLMIKALFETIYMTLVSGGISVIFGLPLGIILFATRKNNFWEAVFINRVLSMIVNATRSIPFIILLVALIPLTRFIVGSSIGTTAAIVPLTIGAIPFVARIIENVVSEIPPGLIEAGHAMGATPFQIIRKILIPESLAGIVNGITVTLVTLISYSAMAGVIGGGGLGDLAIRYGYQRFEADVMIATVFVLVLLVQIIQMLGDYLAKKLQKK